MGDGSEAYGAKQGLPPRASGRGYCGCAAAHDHPHQFLICRGCGATREISDPAVARALESATHRLGFTLARATVEIEGLCEACAHRSATPSATS